MHKEGRASQVAQWERIRLPVQETRRYGIDFWVGKISWSRRWQPAEAFLPGKPHGQRSLLGYSPWGCRELDTTELDEHTKKKATNDLNSCYSEIITWFTTFPAACHQTRRETGTTLFLGSAGQGLGLRCVSLLHGAWGLSGGDFIG